MAFPSGKNQKTLNQAFEDMRSKSRLVKQKAIDIKAKSLAGTLTRKKTMEFPTILADALNVWNAAIVGMAQYAKDQIADQTLDIATEFTSMKSAVISVRDWIIANFPNTTGFLLERTFDANCRIVLGTFSTAATAGLRTELDKIIAAIAD